MEPKEKMKMSPLSPFNVCEAEDYKTKLNRLFNNFMEMLRKDNKDVLEIMI